MLLQYGPHFFRLFRKNLGNLRDFFGQMVYRPPWQKISRTPMYIGLYCNHRCAMEISFGQCYSRTGVTRTLKGNEKQFELVTNSNYWDKFHCDLDQGKKN